MINTIEKKICSLFNRYDQILHYKYGNPTTLPQLQ